jgi:hypothetical protein
MRAFFINFLNQFFYCFFNSILVGLYRSHICFCVSITKLGLSFLNFAVITLRLNSLKLYECCSLNILKLWHEGNCTFVAKLVVPPRFLFCSIQVGTET